MIINKMLKLCKKKKMIQIILFGTHKFLAAGTTAGYIDDDTAAGWSEDDCAIAIGVAAENREGYYRSASHQPAIKIDDMQEAVPMNYTIAECQPFMLENKSVFLIKKEKLSIFDEVHNKRYYLGQVHIDDGCNEDETKLVIASNTFPMGIITPERINLNALKIYAKDLYSGIEISERQGFFDAGGQMGIED